jgi:hypothetical protein
MREDTLELRSGSYVVVLGRFGAGVPRGDWEPERAMWFLRAALATKDNLDKLRNYWARLGWSCDLSRVSDATLIQAAEVAIGQRSPAGVGSGRAGHAFGGP